MRHLRCFLGGGGSGCINIEKLGPLHLHGILSVHIHLSLSGVCVSTCINVHRHHSSASPPHPLLKKKRVMANRFLRSPSICSASAQHLHGVTAWGGRWNINNGSGLIPLQRGDKRKQLELGWLGTADCGALISSPELQCQCFSARRQGKQQSLQYGGTSDIQHLCECVCGHCVFC